jgi:hypothetical protein
MYFSVISVTVASFELVAALHPDFLTNHQCLRVHFNLQLAGKIPITGVVRRLIAACQDIREILTVLVWDMPQVIRESVGLNQLTNHPLGDGNSLSQVFNCLDDGARRCFGILAS